MTSYQDLYNLQAWFSLVLIGAFALWLVWGVVDFLVSIVRMVWRTACVVRRAERIKAISEKQAERRRFQAVMAPRRFQ